MAADARDNIGPKTRALAAYLDEAVKHLSARVESGDVQDGLLFLGNRQDAIPRLLIYDPVLDAAAVRVCMILRTLCHSGTVATAFPTYDQIARHANLTRPTVARVMIILRATRWLTLLGRKIRNSKGQIKGNIYTLHDDPLPLADALYLDPDYIDFLQSLQTHPHSHARRIAGLILASIQDDITDGRDMLSLETLPRTGARCAAQRMIEAPEQGPLTGDDENQFFAIGGRHLKELQRQNHLVKIFNQVDPVDNADLVKNFNYADKNIENNENQQVNEDVKIFNEADPVDNSSSCSCYIYKKTTTTRTNQQENPIRAREVTHTHGGLIFPAQLTEAERKLSLVPLASVDAQHQQAVLDELAGRIHEGRKTGNYVRKPLSYLARLCKEVRDGTFVPSVGVSVCEERKAQRAAMERSKDNLAANGDKAREDKPPIKPGAGASAWREEMKRAGILKQT